MPPGAEVTGQTGCAVAESLLVADVEAQGGRILARSLDARKEADLAAFLQEADQGAPLEVCIFNIGANVNVPRLPSMVSYPVTRWCCTLGQRAFLPLFVSATYCSPFALRIPLRTFSSGHARHGGTHFAPASHRAEGDHPKGTVQWRDRSAKRPLALPGRFC